MKKLFTTLSLVFGLTVASQAQTIERPAPSPVAKVEQAVGLSTISLEYSRPSKKGREIFGGLVRYNEMWRTGANASTKIEFADDVVVAGTPIKAGKYALYTVPSESAWTIIFHNNLTYWGTGGSDYKREEDAARVTVTPDKLQDVVETFTIQFDALRPDGCDLVLRWDMTEVRVPIALNTDEKMQAQIEAFMNPEPNYRPYYNAAAYYQEVGKNLSQALSYVDEALKINQGFWIMHLKAKIQYDLKDYKGAIETAGKSKKAATEAGNNDYVALNEKLIAKAKSKS